MAHFLTWLLAQSGEDYTTQSSDVAGIAFCLSELGLDILSVKRFGERPKPPVSCRLHYNVEATMNAHGKEPGVDSTILGRVPLTTVSLICPEEALTNFPIPVDVANRCRTVWQEGARAAESIKCRHVVPHYDRFHSDDFQYAFWNIGNAPSRVRDEIHNITSAHAFAVNREICQALENVFQHEPSASLRWILDHIFGRRNMGAFKE
jgi:hypothetical protein